MNNEWYELEVLNNNNLSTLQEGGEYLSSYVCDQKVALQFPTQYLVWIFYNAQNVMHKNKEKSAMNRRINKT